MPDENARRSGAKTIKAILLVSVVFGILIAAAYLMGDYKRGVPINNNTPTQVNGNGSVTPAESKN